MPNPPPDDAVAPVIITLYIVGNALNSLRAVANLKAICDTHFPGRYQPDIVDIFDDPLRAIADKVLVTPTLVITAPGARILIVGDLRDTQTVLLALQNADGKL
jgi:circadian clock protein KaiB